MAEIKRWFQSWRTSRGRLSLRKIVQVISTAVILGLLVWSQRVFYLNQRGGAAEFLINLPIRLDPLVMLLQMISSRILLPLGFISLITVGLTLVFGRVWCGWVCPVGAIQDWLSFPGNKFSIRPPADSWRSLKFLILLAMVILAIFSNLSFLIFDPLTILYRTVTTFFLPAADQLITLIERALFRIPILQTPVGAVDSWIRPGILPVVADQFRAGILFGAVFLGILFLNLMIPRFYCRYLCPLGGMLGWIARSSWFRVRVGESCTSCESCVSVCPTGAIRNQNGITIDSAECTMCMVCPTACPALDLSILPGDISRVPQDYDPERRMILLTAGAAALGGGVLGAGPAKQRIEPHLIRPPGVLNDELLQKCIRCGECSEVCPTNVIQPALLETGLEGLWTPLLIPRIGYCDYSCNACGQICPVGAIPALSLEEKRDTVIGKAYVDHDRCLAWADLEDCIVCEEMCPVPEKAIDLEEAVIEEPDGSFRTILQPVVDRERCIGCGICENKCPVSGAAAIRVHTLPLDCLSV